MESTIKGHIEAARKLGYKVLRYDTIDEKLSYLVFYVLIKTAPDMKINGRKTQFAHLEVRGLTRYKERERAIEIFSGEEFRKKISSDDYNKLLTEVAELIFFDVIPHLDVRISNNHFSLYNPFLADSVTKKTEKIVKKYVDPDKIEYVK